MWTIWCDNISRRSFDAETFIDSGVKTAKADNFEALRTEVLRANSQVLTDDDANFASVRIFRENIQPHNTDPENAHGGILTVSVPASQWTVCYFLNFLSLLFNEDPVNGFINGVVLTRAVAMWHVSIWHGRAATQDAKDALSVALRLSSNCSECMATSHLQSEVQAAYNRKRAKDKKKSSFDLKAWREKKVYSTKQPKCSDPIDYDKELVMLLAKYPSGKGVSLWRCDMCSMVGTIVLTAVLTGLRMLW
jgi:hypothetical protein